MVPKDKAVVARRELRRHAIDAQGLTCADCGYAYADTPCILRCYRQGRLHSASADAQYPPVLPRQRACADFKRGKRGSCGL